MPANTVPTPRECPIDRTLELAGDRWFLLILREVLYGKHRFEDFVRYTGGNRDMIASRLVRLVDAGILEKRAYNPSGTRFEYFATPKGFALRPVLVALGEFGEVELPGVEAPWRALATSESSAPLGS
jgi:DNA-binding HxlR family transcriptional regulator